MLQQAWAAALVLVAACLRLFPDGFALRTSPPCGRALFTGGLLYAAMMFVPWVIAASARTLRVGAGRER